MKIKKFEANNYKTKTLLSVNRKDFIGVMIDAFIDHNFFGYECGGTSYEDEILLLYVDKIDRTHIPNKVIDSKVIKFDFSEMGIEIGDMDMGEDPEEDYDGKFVPQVSLDDQVNVELRNNAKIFRKNIKNYNI